jgi:4-alpha-glucanotransferase
MRVGLIADLAVGMTSSGSHAWSRQSDILVGLKVGAPPDLFNARGQDWGLTTFSPHALRAGGFEPFIATLRAGMRHCGGVRIDHAMGLMRLWLIPEGAPPLDGAYVAYPLDDLLRLVALESLRHQAIVIGEDLGTVPAGFRERLAAIGIAGMRVLWFEREQARFLASRDWPSESTAMTSTHDLPTVAGWWRARDIAVRAQCGLVADYEAEQAAREADRAALWSAFAASKAAHGPPPLPDCPARAVDAAVRFITCTPAPLVVLPLEDALAVEDQPNLPGTIDEHPNWRQRYDEDAAVLLDDETVRARLAGLAPRGER